MSTATHLLIRADARRIPLATGSVHMAASSPPYFGLREYDHPDQIGREPTPGEFVDAIRDVARELWRVLRDDGSFWLNLGDSFAGSWGNQGRKEERGSQRPINGPMIQNLSPYPVRESNTGTIAPGSSLKPKDLMMIPERVALALQADGWYIRAKPPWVKPRPMPESVTDRPNVAHESTYLLTKSPRYYFDMEAVRVPSAATTIERDKYTRVTKGKDGAYAVRHDHETLSDPGGRHLRTNDFFTGGIDDAIAHHEACLAHLRRVRAKGGVLIDDDGGPMAFWVGTQSFKGAHFAVWPERLVRLMILASTSEKGCCAACGACWTRVVEPSQAEPDLSQRSTSHYNTGDRYGAGNGGNSGLDAMAAKMREGTHGYKTTGWQPSCRCGTTATAPCVVYDPFAGSGTTLVVANALGRVGIGTDLNRDYLAMARRRIERPHAAMARAGAVPGGPADGFLFPDLQAS